MNAVAKDEEGIWIETKDYSGEYVKWEMIK
jgi:hypothetical protein